MIKNQKMLINEVYIKRKPKFLFEVPQGNFARKKNSIRSVKSVKKHIESVYDRLDTRRVSFW